MRPKLATKSNCTGCTACVDACPHHALFSYINDDGFRYIEVNQNLCVGCGLCENVCPVVNSFAYGEEGKGNCFAAWNNNEEQRQHSSSGGVFSAIATAFLKDGSIIYGAAIDHTKVIHKRITNIEDLSLLQGSKYQQGDLSGIYKSVKDDLRSGKTVLFSGVGCQVGALLSFLKRTPKENLYTIDLVCGGFSSLLPMESFLAQHPDISSIRSFRDKQDGWKSSGFKYCLKMIHNNGETHNYGYNNIVLQSFSSTLLKRKSCNNCRFAYARRKSDATIADFWGDTTFKEQHSRGLSVLVSHNNRLLHKIKDEDILSLTGIEWKKFLVYNFRMVCGQMKWILPIDRYIMLHLLRTKYYQITSWYLGSKLLNRIRHLLIYPSSVKNTKFINKLLNQ